jgi:LmbE family N-acetylglucosaminyl deacetylase
VVAASDGEGAYPNAPGLAAIRTQEQEAALGVLGVEGGRIRRLHLPDGGLPGHRELIENCLLPLMSDEALLLAPWIHDGHPDHETCGRAAQSVSDRTGVPIGFYFFWVWHQGTPEQMKSLPVRRFVLDSELQALRREALGKHRSQFQWRGRTPAVLPESLLGPMARPFESFLIPEPVRCKDNPV